MTLRVIPLKAEYKKSKFDLFDELSKTFSDNKILLENGDVIVISSKYIANSQGRILDANSVSTSDYADYLSKRFRMKSEFIEVVLRESDKYLAVSQDF